ncbi:hypothetical protein GCM10018963_71540 [Saccharothrix longispora]
MVVTFMGAPGGPRRSAGVVRPAAGIVVVSFDVAFVVLVSGYPVGYRENGPLPLRVTVGSG